jgi:hypothetical protein
LGGGGAFITAVPYGAGVGGGFAPSTAAFNGAARG